MIARAPLQLFQAVSTSILPHLTSLHASDDRGQRARVPPARCGWCCSAIAAFTALVVVVVLIAGPKLMQIAFSKKFTYDRARPAAGHRSGWASTSASVTVNQACVAQGQVRRAAVRWIGCAALLHRLELRAAGQRRVPPGRDRLPARPPASSSALLYYVYRRPHERAEDVPAAGLGRGARGAAGGDRRERLARTGRDGWTRRRADPRSPAPCSPPASSGRCSPTGSGSRACCSSSASGCSPARRGSAGSTSTTPSWPGPWGRSPWS